LTEAAPNDLDRRRLLQVEADTATTTPEDSMSRIRESGVAPIDANDIGTEVCEQHARIGRRADPGELDDPNALKRTRFNPLRTIHPDFLRPLMIISVDIIVFRKKRTYFLRI